MSYVPVHQVWSFVTYKPKSEQPDVVSVKEKPNQTDKTRYMVQYTRIKKKIDIITLAKEVGTTPKTLVQYEKGEDILTKEILEKIFVKLDLSLKGKA